MEYYLSIIPLYLLIYGKFKSKGKEIRHTKTTYDLEKQQHKYLLTCTTQLANYVFSVKSLKHVNQT